MIVKFIIVSIAIALPIIIIIIIMPKDKNWSFILNSTLKKVRRDLHLNKMGYINRYIGGVIDKTRIKIGKDSFNYKFKIEPVIRGNNSIFITKETYFSKLKKGLGFDDVRIGDDNFDKRMVLYATNASHIIALLNFNIRKKILEIEKDFELFEISYSSIKANLPITPIKSYKTIISYIKTLIYLSTELNHELSKDTIKKLLLQNLKTEKIPEVIIVNIQKLNLLFSNDNEVKSALKKLLNNKNIQIQLQAAKSLNEEGMDHLLSMLKSNKIESESDIVTIVTIFKENGYKKSIEFLMEIFNKSVNKDLLTEIISCFTSFKDKKVCSFLVKQLHDRRKIDMRSYIIEALGFCGDLSAVESLYKISRNSKNPLIKNSAKNSIAQIQSQYSNIEKGWLSINKIQEKEGALSISKSAEEGALSITKKNDPLK